MKIRKYMCRLRPFVPTAPTSMAVIRRRFDSARRKRTPSAAISPINGLFFDPLENRLIDYVGGRADLESRLLRAIGDPHQRFAEDKLRLMRGVRMAARFGLEIEPSTLDAIKAMANQITVVSAERIADELKKMLALPERAQALGLFMDLGLARAVLPEIVPLRGLAADPSDKSKSDTWGHILRTLAHLGKDASFPLAFGCLLHELGKSGPNVTVSSHGRADSPEKVSSLLADNICRRLKLSVAERERVAWLIVHQECLRNAENLPLHKLKKILANPGIRELLALHRADALADERPVNHVEYGERMLERWSEDELNPPAFVTGHDVEALGMRPGPGYKELLETVRDAQLDGIIATREEALVLLERALSSQSQIGFDRLNRFAVMCALCHAHRILGGHVRQRHRTPRHAFRVALASALQMRQSHRARYSLLEIDGPHMPTEYRGHGTSTKPDPLKSRPIYNPVRFGQLIAAQPR